MKCRYCGSELDWNFVDLGMAPLSNDFLRKEKICEGQHNLPLNVEVCPNCKLVQVINYEMPEKIFNEEYKYFSSYSQGWLKHCEIYVNKVVEKLKLKTNSCVVEIASNDGYLLQYFLKYGIKPIGIEPSEACADIAIEKGIETRKSFFSEEYALNMRNRGEKADLIIGNNVLAHVPNIGDFVKGLKILLKEEGMITMEFPHLINILKYNQFDTIYHEHFSYLSLLAVSRIFEEQGLVIVDVEKLNTHGGSLRIYAMHDKVGKEKRSITVENLLKEEIDFGLQNKNIYKEFGKKVQEIKFEILHQLIKLKQKKKIIVGYGAAAKGNTLLNYCGIGREMIDYVVDASPHKQGLYLPGSLLPIKDPKEIECTKPDYLIILPWNIKEEIENDWQKIRGWGGKFISLIPEVKIW